MRILHLVKTTVGAVWAIRQMRVLLNHGHDIHVVLPDHNGLYQTYVEAGITVHVIPLNLSGPFGILQLGRQAIALRKLVQRVQPDLIHSHFVSTTLFMRAALVGIPVKRIFQVPGPLHLEHGVTRMLEIMLSNSWDYWIASCHKTRDIYLRAGIPGSRIGLSFYGMDLTCYSNKPKGKLRSLLQLSDDQKIIGMVAFTYAPRKWLGHKRGIKGHEDFIDAMVQVVDKHNCIACVIGGPWQGANDYFNQVVAYGKSRLGDNIVFLGTRQDVPELYPDFDVVVHPSHSENLGGAAESLLMGVPTLATNIGGFPDIVVEGKTGWLAPPADPHALAVKIMHILDDPQEAARRASNGKALVLEELDVVNTAGRVDAFYRDIA